MEGDVVAAGQPLGCINGDEALASLKEEQIQLSKLRKKQQLLQELLKKYEVASPVSGEVKALFVKKDDAVWPDTVLAAIEDPALYQIDIPVTEKESTSILPGLPARVIVQEAGSRQYNGKVDRITKGTVDENGRFLRSVVVFKREPGLETGTTVLIEVLPKL